MHNPQPDGPIFNLHHPFVGLVQVIRNWQDHKHPSDCRIDLQHDMKARALQIMEKGVILTSLKVDSLRSFQISQWRQYAINVLKSPQLVLSRSCPSLNHQSPLLLQSLHCLNRYNHEIPKEPACTQSWWLPLMISLHILGSSSGGDLSIPPVIKEPPTLRNKCVSCSYPGKVSILIFFCNTCITCNTFDFLVAMVNVKRNIHRKLFIWISMRISPFHK